MSFAQLLLSWKVNSRNYCLKLQYRLLAYDDDDDDVNKRNYHSQHGSAELL